MWTQWTKMGVLFVFAIFSRDHHPLNKKYPQYFLIFKIFGGTTQNSTKSTFSTFCFAEFSRRPPQKRYYFSQNSIYRNRWGQGKQNGTRYRGVRGIYRGSLIIQYIFGVCVEVHGVQRGTDARSIELLLYLKKIDAGMLKTLFLVTISVY